MLALVQHHHGFFFVAHGALRVGEDVHLHDADDAADRAGEHEALVAELAARGARVRARRVRRPLVAPGHRAPVGHGHAIELSRVPYFAGATSYALDHAVAERLAPAAPVRREHVRVGEAAAGGAAVLGHRGGRAGDENRAKNGAEQKKTDANAHQRTSQLRPSHVFQRLGGLADALPQFLRHGVSVRTED